MYCILFSEKDSIQLASELRRINTWCTHNNMPLNVSECVDVSFTKKLKELHFQYVFYSEPIRIESTHKYLGVTFSEDGFMSAQGTRVIQKAGKSLSFFQLELKHVSSEVTNYY